VALEVTDAPATGAMTLPGAVGVVPDAASPIVFDGSAFGTGSAPMTVTLSVAGDGVFEAAALGVPGADAQAVSVSGSGTREITLGGSAAALSAYLAASPARLSYTGVATQALTVRTVVAGQAGVAQVQAARDQLRVSMQEMQCVSLHGPPI
jgi:hypothetical protein